MHKKERLNKPLFSQILLIISDSFSTTMKIQHQYKILFITNPFNYTLFY